MASLLIAAAIVFAGFGTALVGGLAGSDQLFQLGSSAVLAGIGFFLGHRAGKGNGTAAKNGG